MTVAHDKAVDRVLTMYPTPMIKIHRQIFRISLELKEPESSMTSFRVKVLKGYNGLLTNSNVALVGSAWSRCVCQGN